MPKATPKPKDPEGEEKLSGNPPDSNLAFLVNVEKVTWLHQEAVFEFDTSDWTQMAPPGYTLPVWCKKATWAALPEPKAVGFVLAFRDVCLELPAPGDNCGYAHMQPQCIYRHDTGVRAKFKITARIHPTMAVLCEMMMQPSDLQLAVRSYAKLLED